MRFTSPKKNAASNTCAPLALAIHLALGGVIAGTSLPTLAAQQNQTFDIPAGSLGEALSLFARQAGVAISFDADQVRGLSSPGLQGSHDLATGFAQLLQGSPLQAVAGADGYLLIPRPAQQGALELNATSINGKTLGATTEDSGSYTTGTVQGATKLSLSIRQTPQSATVLTRQRMDDQAIKTLDDVVTATPGLTLKKEGSQRPRIFARGFQVDNIMYDGIPTTISDVSTSNLAMYDHVEVVRGATGLMQGAGNPGASINVVRKRPTADARATLTGSAGSWDNYRGEVDVSGPLDAQGKLRGRLVTSYRDSNDFVDLAEHDHKMLYGILEADLGENTEISFGLSLQNEKNKADTFGSLPVASNGSDLHLPRSTNLTYDWGYWNKRENQFFVELKHHLANDWNLVFSNIFTKAESSYLSTTVPYISDTTSYLHDYDYTSDRNSHDLYLSGPVSVLHREHELVAGISYSKTDETTEGQTSWFTEDNTVYDWNPHQGIPGPGFPDYYPGYGLDNTLKSTQKSAYLTTRLNIADPLKVILGARLDWYDYDQNLTYSDEPDPYLTQYKVTRHVTKYAGIVYDLNTNHSVYVSYTDIFKPQSNLDVNGSPLEPITGKNYEIGLKGEYFDGALNADFALFQIDQENRAKQLDDALCNVGTSCYEASGLVRSQGVDLEINGALTDNWQVAVGYVFSQAKYKKDATASNEGKLFDTGLPRHQLKLASTYKLSGELERWRVGGSINWQNTVYYKGTSSGTPWYIEQKAYAIANLMVGYQASNNLDLQANFNNVLNKRYYSDITRYPTNSNMRYGAPSNFLVTATYRF